MGKVKQQQLWRSEHATDWEEDLPTWYQYHERELDQVVSDVIIHRANEPMCTYASPYEDDGGDPELIEALEFWIVQDWFGDELKKRDEIVNEDFLGFCIWGRTTSGQAISMDYVVQDILKDIVETRSKYRG